jgi:hypothetical protein
VKPVGQQGFPAVDEVPETHATHTDDEVPPVPKNCFPAGHEVHAEANV